MKYLERQTFQIHNDVYDIKVFLFQRFMLG